MNAELRKWNNFLLCLRYLLCIINLPGYMHPDQFFQSSEVMAGKFLDYNVTYSWEWQGDVYLRNSFFPLISSGFPFLFIRRFQMLFTTKCPANLLLILPRLSSVLLLTLCEIVFCKLTRALLPGSVGVQDYILFLWRSSYVTLIICLLGFSNNMELFAFTLLLYLVLHAGNQTSKNKTVWNEERYFFLLGAVLSFGIFVRPSFVCFCAFPLLLTVCRDVMLGRLKSSHKILSQITPVACMGFGVVAAALPLVAVDVWMHWNGSWRIIFTPLRFISYNVNSNNLKKHGLHPWYLHAISNLPMLLGPAYFVFINRFAIQLKELLSKIKAENQNFMFESLFSSPAVITGEVQLMASAIAATVFLSIIPHQEMRFLLPLITPVLIITGAAVFQSSYNRSFTAFWLCFNSLMSICFGYLHQGGIIPCLLNLNEQIHSPPAALSQGQHYHIVFWKTYTAPLFLLQLPQEGGLDVTVVNLEGASEATFFDHIQSLKPKTQMHWKVFVVLPSTVWKYENICRPFKLFWPHLSMENPPWESERHLSSMWNLTDIIHSHWSLLLCEVI